MESKNQILKEVKKDFDCWEDLLSRLSDRPRVFPLHPSHLSVKDNVAHLQAWQIISIVRTEAALRKKSPIYPQWPNGLDPDSDDDLDQINEWIYTKNKNLTWQNVYKNWKEGFLRFQEIGKALGEVDPLFSGKYKWLGNYSLSFVFSASCEHHAEHRELIEIWFKDHPFDLESVKS